MTPPTVGRVVHYFDGRRRAILSDLLGPTKITEQAAIVVGVTALDLEEGLFVHLTVFDGPGGLTSKTFVPFTDQEDVAPRAWWPKQVI